MREIPENYSNVISHTTEEKSTDIDDATLKFVSIALGLSLFVSVCWLAVVYFRRNSNVADTNDSYQNIENRSLFSSLRGRRLAFQAEQIRAAEARRHELEAQNSALQARSALLDDISQAQIAVQREQSARICENELKIRELKDKLAACGLTTEEINNLVTSSGSARGDAGSSSSAIVTRSPQTLFAHKINCEPVDISRINSELKAQLHEQIDEPLNNKTSAEIEKSNDAIKVLAENYIAQCH